MKLQKISVDEMRGICASALERLEAIAEAEGSNCEWLFVKHYFYVYMEHLVSNELNYYYSFRLYIVYCTVTKLLLHPV